MLILQPGEEPWGSSIFSYFKSKNLACTKSKVALLKDLSAKMLSNRQLQGGEIVVLVHKKVWESTRKFPDAVFLHFGSPRHFLALFCYCPPPRPFAPPTYTCYSILVSFHTLTYTIIYKRHLQFNYAAKF